MPIPRSFKLQLSTRKEAIWGLIRIKKPCQEKRGMISRLYPLFVCDIQHFFSFYFVFG